jgi:hypothetical protein
MRYLLVNPKRDGQAILECHRTAWLYGRRLQVRRPLNLPPRPWVFK